MVDVDDDEFQSEATSLQPTENPATVDTGNTDSPGWGENDLEHDEVWEQHQKTWQPVAISMSGCEKCLERQKKLAEEKLQEEQAKMEMVKMEIEIERMEQQRSVCTSKVHTLLKQKEQIPGVGENIGSKRISGLQELASFEYENDEIGQERLHPLPESLKHTEKIRRWLESSEDYDLCT